MPEYHTSQGALILEDGRIFRGEPFGALVDAEGEAVFTTSMTGYQEIATDPSFRGQLVCMTFPLIGNYGVSQGDDQSRRPWIAGLIVREYCDEPSHWRLKETLHEYLRRHGIPALHSVDTRALTRHLRDHGAMRALLVADRAGLSDDELRERARQAWSPTDEDVVASVSISAPREVQAEGDPHLVLLDCGLKEHIVTSLTRRGARVTVVPYDTPAAEILALRPDGIVTSPGPGDPAQAEAALATVRDLLVTDLPFFGICLGHQLLALAIGARTSRLTFGHRGGNHPVKELATGRVRITSQNHGYQVDAASVPVADGWRVSQISLNDGTVEGLEHVERPVFSIQYHPEGAPGPLDSQDLFDRFLERVRQYRRQTEEDESAVAVSAGGGQE